VQTCTDRASANRLQRQHARCLPGVSKYGSRGASGRLHACSGSAVAGAPKAGGAVVGTAAAGTAGAAACAEGLTDDRPGSAGMTEGGWPWSAASPSISVVFH
jgi:hypothetical protein